MHMCMVGVYTLPLFGGFSRILYDYTNQIQTECVAHRNACQTSAHDTKSNYFEKSRSQNKCVGILARGEGE
jgi:hypothetical protein